MDRVEDKLNLEAHVWLLSGVFKSCKDRTMKASDFNKPGSGVASDEELRQFTNCVTKNLKAVALFPATIN